MHVISKFFSNKNFRDDFENGSLYFSSLSEFTKLYSERALMAQAENGDQQASLKLEKLRNHDQRDIFEGTIADVERKLTMHQTEDCLIDSELTENSVCDVKLRAVGYSYCNVQCFSKIEYKLELKSGKAQFGYDIPDMSSFGAYGLFITNQQEFIRRVKLAADKAGYDLLCGDVNYHPLKIGDKKIIGGNMLHLQGEEPYLVDEILERVPEDKKYDAFDKWEKYKDQHEWRIVLNTHEAKERPIRLELGSLADITVRFDAKQFANKLDKLLLGFKIKNLSYGYQGNTDRMTMRDQFYKLGENKAYIFYILGKVEYS